MKDDIKDEEIEDKKNADDYLKLETDKLNAEIRELQKEIRTREQFSLTILALISAWTYTEKLKNQKSITLLIVAAVPLITIIIYAYSVQMIYQNINFIGKYLKQIEIHFLKKARSDCGFKFGWERLIEKEARKTKFVKVTTLVWILQILMAIGLIIFACSNNNDNTDLNQSHNKVITS